VVGFRPSAGDNIGMELAAKAPAGGYTLVQASSSLTIGPSLHEKLGFHAVRDFQPISKTTTVSHVIVVHPSAPARTLGELAQLSRTRPNRLTFGSDGIGSGNHLSNEMFMSLNTIHMAHVPYSGASIALTHTLSGEIDLVSVTVPAAIPFLKSGKLCGLAVLSSARPPRLPNVPTSEQASCSELLLES
jgi:tripartite-type tricarboxylate transporter receptor subunit TctC